MAQLNMIGIIGLVVAILSFLAMFSTKTPVGKKIGKILFLNDTLIDSFFENYRKYLLSTYTILFIVVVYMVFSVLDFYRTNQFIFSMFYMVLFLAYLDRKNKAYIGHYGKFSIQGLIALSILILFAIGFESMIDSGTLDERFLQVKKHFNINQNMKNAASMKEYRCNYEESIRISTISNMFLLEYTKYKEPFELGPSFDNSKTKQSKYLNELKFRILSHPDESIKEYYRTSITGNSKLLKVKTSILPPEIQPEFVGALIVDIFSRKFSALATGTKISFLGLWISITSRFGLWGLSLGFPILIFASYQSALKIKEYNKRYDPEGSTDNLILIFLITVLGLFVAIISML